MAVNLNLPPDIRCHLDETWILCIIPGPNQPKDPDSFHWPLVEELTKAAIGINTYDAVAREEFLLHIYPLLGGGDGPGAAKVWLHCKTHSASSPCRACEIRGIRPPPQPGKRAAPVSYIPLKPPEGFQREELDPLNLPLRYHDRFIKQAHEVQFAPTAAETTRLSVLYGINGTSIYSQLSSFRFPNSFPVDFMHLLENVMESLVILWTGNFKGLDEGTSDYILEKTVWEAIGTATAASSTHLPAAFGRRLPDISQDRTYYTAEAWLVWTSLLARPLLYQRFKHPRYYDHFVQLVGLLNDCLSWEITTEKVRDIRTGLALWVREFERIYYQYNANRLSICTLQIHMLLHVADTILDAGPVWVYWVFVMERLCGRLQRSVTSRRQPFSSMNTWAIEWEQLKIIKNRFGVANVLRGNDSQAKEVILHDSYPYAMPLKPCKKRHLTADQYQRLLASIGTRFGKIIKEIQHLVSQEVMCWNRLQRTDGGDLFRIASAVERTSGYRDNSYVKYELLVDKHARFARRAPEYITQTYFGRLEAIYEVPLCADPIFGPNSVPEVLLMAAIKPCNATCDTKTGLYSYKDFKPIEVVDLQTIQAVVGRVFDRGSWTIIDRSGELARATFVAGGNDLGED